MKERIFVFRLAKGNDSGTPIGRCPLDYSEIKKEISELTNDDITKIDYGSTNYVEFLYKELWENNILRQGWGIRNLDLKQDVRSWIENYMLNGKKFWDRDIECDVAKGRWNILSRMLKMKNNDYIIIPNTSNNIEKTNDYAHFTVCQVDGNYYFDYPEKIMDFGHCIKVKNIRVFKYSEDSLLRSDFSAPYLWAITEVRKHHRKYEKFDTFLNRVYVERKSTDQYLPYELILNKKKEDGIHIEIRKESVSHHTPHLHITHTDKADVSISLDDFSILAGHIDRKMKKKLLPFLKNKKSELNEIWDELNENENSVRAEILIQELNMKLPK